ncbi:MAG: GspE/PulE family protein [Burkholderiales bacterium]
MTNATNAEELARILSAQATRHHTLGQNLVNRGLISAVALREALHLQQSSPDKKLGDILLETGAATESAIQSALLEELDVPTVLLGEFDLDPKAASLLSADMVRDMRVIPLMFFGDTLVLAVSKLPEAQELELLRFTIERPIRFVLADKAEIDQLIYRTYLAVSTEHDLANLELTSTDAVDESRIWKDAELLANKAPLVHLVNLAIQDAINQHASDIHIRPGEKSFDLLYRIDGTLVNIRQFQIGLLPAIVSRIKILSRLNIAEHRLPQDGRIRVKSGLQTIDLRISIIPVQYGESIVVRILNKNEGLRSIAEIGFSRTDQDIFLDLIKRSYGIILVTGPTGSGKSTTLYAALQEVERENVNIITVEDPIEYELAHTRQIQLIQQIGFGFPEALRHILRHDPDVIMIGEMRDLETCKIAVESALTGHLVFSTLHTNDAPSALVRLLEIGVAPYMIRSAVIGVLAQRLVRSNCKECLCEETISPLMRKNLGLADDEIFYRGAGCKNCHQTGLKGRVAIYELLVMNDALRKHVQAGVSSDEFLAVAVQDGMVTMPVNGVAMARTRQVSIAEVYRACM